MLQKYFRQIASQATFHLEWLDHGWPLRSFTLWSMPEISKLLIYQGRPKLYWEVSNKLLEEGDSAHYTLEAQSHCLEWLCFGELILGFLILTNNKKLD